MSANLILDWDIFQDEILDWYTIILYKHFCVLKGASSGTIFSCKILIFFFRVCKILIKCQASTYSTYHRCMYSCPSIMSDTDNTKLVRIIESILAPTKQVLPLIVRANLAHELVTKIITFLRKHNHLERSPCHPNHCKDLSDATDLWGSKTPRDLAFSISHATAPQ